MTQTLKVFKLFFCPQKFCNYLMGRCREPSSSQTCTGVRQEATDKFKYEKLRLDLRKKNFHLRMAEYWSRLPKAIVDSPSLEILETQLEKAPSNLIQLALLWAGGWDQTASQGPSNLRAPMTPWNYTLGAPWGRFYCFFFLTAVIIFICIDLPESLKTGSFRSMLRTREVPNRASFILLVLMRTTQDILSNWYWQHRSKSQFLNLKTWKRELFCWNTVHSYWIASRCFRFRDGPRILLKLTTGKFCQNLFPKQRLN